MSAAAWMNYANPYVGKPVAKRTRAKYRWIEFVRPDCYHAYSLEQRLGVFRWMVETASAIVPTSKETGRWGASNALCLLNMHPTCVNDYLVNPITSINNLDDRFKWALLSGWAGASAQRWKRENGISLDSERVIYFPHYEPFAGAPLEGKWLSEVDIQKRFTALLNTTDVRLNVSLNDCHPEAKTLERVVLAVSMPYTVSDTGQRVPAKFVFRFYYSYSVEEPSSWNHVLATSNDAESVIDTMDRAITALNELTA